MTTIFNPVAALERNILREMKEVMRGMSKESVLEDDDMKSFEEIGLTPVAATRAFLADPEVIVSGSFHRDMVAKFSRGEVLSLRQCRAVLNICKDHEFSFKRPWNFTAGDGNRHTTCPDCGEEFDDLLPMLVHRKHAHDWKPERFSYEAALVDPEAVTDVKDETEVDLIGAGLVRGRYTFLDPLAKSRGGFRSVVVEYLKKPRHLDRKYTYGKILHGSEIAPMGTMLIREFESDRKELVGLQKPGERYRGRFEDKLLAMCGDLPMHAQLFAIKHTRCGICGKRLEVEESKLALIGPECERNYTNYAKYFAEDNIKRLLAELSAYGLAKSA